MNRIHEITMKQDASMKSTHDAVGELRDPNAIKEVLDETINVIAPPFADLRALESEREQILRNPKLSDAGRNDALAALEAKRKDQGSQHVKNVADVVAKKQKETAQTEDAADAGLEPHGSGFVVRNHVSTDLAKIVLDGQARDRWSRMEPAKFSQQYREWVVSDDPRARVAEQDPAGALVSVNDRQWARRWRIEHSTLLPRIKVLRAQHRSYTLALTWIEMGFGVRASETVDA